MSVPRLLQLLLLISVTSIMAVAGALIISSHTTSTRAASLLASFVLIPTTTSIMMQFPLYVADRWDLVRLILLFLIAVMLVLVRTGLKIFNREEILSREQEQRNLRQLFADFTLTFREYQPAGVPFSAYQGARLSPRRFYRRELPALLYELRLPLLIALIAALSGLLGGSYLGSVAEVEGTRDVLARIGDPPEPGIGLALSIFANNLRVSLMTSMLSLFTLGLFSFLVPAAAFGQVGYVAATLDRLGGSWQTLGADSPLQFVLSYVVPHGSVELPTFILTAGLGIRLGAALLAPPEGFTVGQNIIWSLGNFFKVWLLLIAPLVLVAALIEGLISPQVVLALYGG
jgi:uncharacterized membrane protein SpoIIM required for sporulation